MSPGARIRIALLSIILPSGCAVVDPEPDYELVADYVEEATGADGLFQPGSDESVGKKVEELLGEGLYLDEAVQIALLNNRELQANLFTVGMARADAVQAGLLSNPSLSALVRFPTTGGAVDTEVQLVQNLIELWHLPVKKSMAERRLRGTILETAHLAASLAVNTKELFYSAVACERSLKIEEENSEILQNLLALTTERQQGGAATEIDVNVVRSELLQQEITTARARLETLEKKRRLAEILGLAVHPAELELADTLPASTTDTATAARVLELARAHRLDLQAAREVVETARQNLALEKRLFLRRVEPGVALESRGTSDVAIGPALDIELPVFDQNQAQIAKADFRHQQAQKHLEALELSITQDVHVTCDRFLSAAEVLRVYSERLIPLQKTNLELAQESFRLGRTGFLSVLQAQRGHLDARRSYTKQLEAYALTLPDLERVSGQPLSRILEADGATDSGPSPNHPEEQQAPDTGSTENGS